MAVSNKEVIESLRDYREWAESNIFEVPIDLPDVLAVAADTIENMGKHIEILQQEVETQRKRAERLADVVVCVMEKKGEN